MELIKFQGKIITPVFSGNAFGRMEAEFRPPEVKALLSYWWRAINPQLADNQNWKKSKLYNYGRKIFGGEYEEAGKPLSGKSKINIVSFTTHLRRLEGKHSPKMVPHKGDGIPSRAIEPQDFHITFKDSGIIYFDDIEIMSKNKFNALVKLSFALGGLGKRSRKGNGHIMLTKNGLPETKNLDDIFELLQILNRGAFLKNNESIEIKPLEREDMAGYPFIRKIMFHKSLRKDEESVRLHIDEVMGEHHKRLRERVQINSKNYGIISKEKYEANLGYAPPKPNKWTLPDNRKFASPLVFSILSDGYSYGINATLLNTVQDKYDQELVDPLFQEEVAKSVLGL